MDSTVRELDRSAPSKAKLTEKYKYKIFPLPGIEPGSPGWKPDILTAGRQRSLCSLRFLIILFRYWRNNIATKCLPLDQNIYLNKLYLYLWSISYFRLCIDMVCWQWTATKFIMCNGGVWSGRGCKHKATPMDAMINLLDLKIKSMWTFNRQNCKHTLRCQLQKHYFHETY